MDYGQICQRDELTPARSHTAGKPVGVGLSEILIKSTTYIGSASCYDTGITLGSGPPRPVVAMDSSLWADTSLDDNGRLRSILGTVPNVCKRPGDSVVINQEAIVLYIQPLLYFSFMPTLF